MDAIDYGWPYFFEPCVVLIAWILGIEANVIPFQFSQRGSMYLFTTVGVTVGYVILAFFLTPVAVTLLRPIAGIVGKMTSAPVMAEKKLVGVDAALFEFTGTNFFLMLMVFAFYGSLSWLVTSRFDVWPWPIYFSALLLIMNYWINVASRMPSWSEPSR